MALVEKLLEPISEQNRCGTDLSYDPRVQKLDTDIKGKPGTEFGRPAEEPNWPEIRDRCVDLLSQSKDLRLAVHLSLALLKTDGLPGFRDGLAILRGLVERYWADIYPRLDPNDKNDPTERVNILASLCTPVGTFGDSLRFLERLQFTPLCHSERMKRFFSLGDILKSQAGTFDVDASQMQGIFRDADPTKLRETGEAVLQSISQVKATDEFLTKTIGSAAPDWGTLIGKLNEIQKCLRPYLGQEAVMHEGEPTEGQPGVGRSTEPSGRGSEAVESRKDVIRALEQICGYYSKYEPSSPIPFLLRRAQRLVEKDFVQIITDLAPDALKQVKTVTGPGTGESPGTAGQP